MNLCPLFPVSSPASQVLLSLVGFCTLFQREILTSIFRDFLLLLLFSVRSSTRVFFQELWAVNRRGPLARMTGTLQRCSSASDAGTTKLGLEKHSIGTQSPQTTLFPMPGFLPELRLRESRAAASGEWEGDSACLPHATLLFCKTINSVEVKFQRKMDRALFPMQASAQQVDFPNCFM